jgi:peptidoglycan L-alanyl-D-glutamate endopeptidase CwlK
MPLVQAQRVKNPPLSRVFLCLKKEVLKMFKLSNRSRTNLVGVHHDLVEVIERAIQITNIDFGVSEGLRTVERQKQMLLEKRSTTMKSKHIMQADGLGHAVDLYVLVNNKASWKHEDFRPVVQAVFTAAIELDVQIRAGALFRSFLDSPHFELNQHYQA